ncbi:type II toxin-antitoxin system HicA family toxin [Microcoleus sp. bin38.metabat.b11b12b14.051]|uniref:type II toxin-antitoxin system HicA family toxin n=1 Tax=Microcoleus sp. bin38.metabat.b11b12b14.051 TaxID=2742709 RepID=UPI0025F4249F|nr:type II toxin-antitoxin system HicA family toxin [Microcoleus sp. bin38.metabat.b11b12b14.051]
MPTKVRDIIKQLEADGWYLARTRGSHRQYKHPTKSGLVTVPGKLSDDLAPGTSNNILKQAQLREVKEQEEPNEVETNHQDEDLN